MTPANAWNENPDCRKESQGTGTDDLMARRAFRGRRELRAQPPPARTYSGNGPATVV
ncbi:hypothetical protein ACIOKD_31925 [Streptomyces sp. NPDC087844]|uniref:hypothetical protein n=1 Tax=Streptomyces sp. NPDC087844 TaxID=3365805 RepID=UPI00380E4783